MKTVTRFIQVRNTGQSKKGHKKLYVKGYVGQINKPDLAAYMKLKDGKYRKFKSLFTKECLEDMRKQALMKNIFVDTHHKIAVDHGILDILKKKGASKDEIEEVKRMLKVHKLPFAKPIEFDINDEGFVFAAETNPYFAELDDDHARYYDANINSILDGYIDGYSFNFDPVDYVTETDNDGNELTKFSKCEIYGISMAGGVAHEDNRFTEVAVRNMMEIRNTKGETKMPDEQKKEEQPEPPKEVTKPEQSEKKENSDIDTLIDRKVEERLKAKELEKQQEDQKKEYERLKLERDELKKQLEKSTPNQGPKGIVRQNDKFGDMQNQQNSDENILLNREKTVGHLSKIKSDHDLYMEDIRKGVHPSLAKGRFMGGFGELIQLQADFRSHELRQPGESDTEYRQRMILQASDSKDDMVIKRVRTI